MACKTPTHNGCTGFPWNLPRYIWLWMFTLFLPVLVLPSYSQEEILSFDDPVNILKSKLHFPDERAKYFVKRFDRNGDGKLSESEFNNFKALISHTLEFLLPKFKGYDKDGNGFITLSEASNILKSPPFNFPSAKVDSLLRNFDTDNNGKLGIEEFAGFYAEAKFTHDEFVARFDQLDVDKNGVLSQDEVVSVTSEMGFGEAMDGLLIHEYDKNQDGNLDKAEFMDLWTSMFD